MKKNILALAALLLAAMPSLAAKYTIKVKSNPKGFAFEKVVSLVLSGRDSLQVLDKKPIDADGNVTFTGNIDRANALGYLQYGDNDRYKIPVIIEDGTITVSQDMKTFIVSASGTPLNNDFNKMFDEASAKAKGAKDAGQRAVVYRQVTDSTFKQHTNDALGALLFLQNNEVKENDYDTMQKLWGQLGEYPKSLRELRNLRDRVTGYHLCHEGMMFKNFTIKGGSIDGKDVKLSDFVGKGKYIFVDFWASWCSACRNELPNVRVAYAENKGKNIDFLGILIWDKRKQAEKAIKEEDLPWTQVIDSDGISGRTYGLSFIPQTFLFAPDGKLLKIGLRGKELDNYLKENIK